MARAIAVRSDFNAPDLRRLARRSKDAAQARRLLALAAIYDGGTRSEAARLGHVREFEAAGCARHEQRRVDIGPGITKAVEREARACIAAG